MSEDWCRCFWTLASCLSRLSGRGTPLDSVLWSTFVQGKFACFQRFWSPRTFAGLDPRSCREDRECFRSRFPVHSLLWRFVVGNASCTGRFRVIWTRLLEARCQRTHILFEIARRWAAWHRAAPPSCKSFQIQFSHMQICKYSTHPMRPEQMAWFHWILLSGWSRAKRRDRNCKRSRRAWAYSALSFDALLPWYCLAHPPATGEK